MSDKNELEDYELDAIAKHIQEKYGLRSITLGGTKRLDSHMQMFMISQVERRDAIRMAELHEEKAKELRKRHAKAKTDDDELEEFMEFMAEKLFKNMPKDLQEKIEKIREEIRNDKADNCEHTKKSIEELMARIRKENT